MTVNGKFVTLVSLGMLCTLSVLALSAYIFSHGVKTTAVSHEHVIRRFYTTNTLDDTKIRQSETQHTNVSLEMVLHHELDSSKSTSDLYEARTHYSSTEKLSPDDYGASSNNDTKLAFKGSFSFPWPQMTKSLSEIKVSTWINDLRRHLKKVHNSTLLSLITAGSNHTDVVLNWLISASIRSSMSLSNIIVLSLDVHLHTLLVRKKINSVYIPPAALFKKEFSGMINEVAILLSVMRIINHFGYDVVMYDTNAIILKNPEPMYIELPSQDIIGSLGTIPHDLMKDWSITIYTDVLLVRSTPRTEMFWDEMKRSTYPVNCQDILHHNLKALDVRWLNNGSNPQNTIIYGITKNKLMVSILPYDDICKLLSCDIKRRQRYYIWYKGGQHNSTWFLKHRWKNVDNSYTDIKWLTSLVNKSTIHS